MMMFRFPISLLVFLSYASALAIAQEVELPSPADSIGSGVIAEDSMFADPGIPVESQPAYQSELFPDVGWINPSRWWAGPNWEKGVEIGINGSEGNAQALSLLTSGRLKRITDTSEWGIDVVYAKTEANDVLTQHYAFFNSRYDYKFDESRWSLFNIARLEYDEFKAFDLRFAINGGIGYAFIKNDTRKWIGRFGAGASREFGSADEDWVPEAVFGTDYEHKLSDRQKLSFTSDYYPAWEDFRDYRLVSQASWELLIDEATNLSLKIGLLDRYDSTPMGRKANDVDYYITLLWKL